MLTVVTIRPTDTRIVVIRIWRDGPDSIRLRIVDGAELPPARRQTIVAGTVADGLTELSRILVEFARPEQRPRES